jgi:hypothetical protein
VEKDNGGTHHRHLGRRWDGRSWISTLGIAGRDRNLTLSAGREK